MRFGIHVPKQGSFTATARYARDIGCETIQIFSGNPTGWQIGSLRPDDRDGFVRIKKSAGIDPVLLHSPYLINLASTDERLRGLSTGALIDAMIRASDLESGPVVVHAGNHKGVGVTAGIGAARSMIERALAFSPPEATLAIENGAGAGTAIGVSIDELAEIVGPFPAERVGILLDTAHLWAVGYDLRQPDQVGRLVDDVRCGPGLERLWAIHANDSLKRLGSRRDVHAMWTDGRMGMRAMRNLIRSTELQELPIIFEVPGATAEFDRTRLAAMKRRDRRHGRRPARSRTLPR